MGNVVSRSFATYKKRKQEERVMAIKIKERWEKKNIKKVGSLRLGILSLRKDALGQTARNERKRRRAAMIRKRVLPKPTKKRVATRRRSTSKVTKRKTRRKAAPKRRANAFRRIGV